MHVREEVSGRGHAVLGRWVLPCLVAYPIPTLHLPGSYPTGSVYMYLSLFLPCPAAYPTATLHPIFPPTCFYFSHLPRPTLDPNLHNCLSTFFSPCPTAYPGPPGLPGTYPTPREVAYPVPFCQLTLYLARRRLLPRSSRGAQAVRRVRFSPPGAFWALCPPVCVGILLFVSFCILLQKVLSPFMFRLWFPQNSILVVYPPTRYPPAAAAGMPRSSRAACDLSWPTRHPSRVDPAPAALARRDRPTRYLPYTYPAPLEKCSD